MKLSRILSAVAALVVSGHLAFAAAIPSGIPTGTPPWDPSQIGNYLQQVIAATNQYASGFQPNNFLDNGDFTVTQRGTGIATGGTTSGPGITAYAADRWAVECNVGSCAPRGQVVTSVTGVTLAPGFANAISLYRNSGALTQPISLEQEVESLRATLLQGKPVIMSCWLANNAVVPAGNTVAFHLFTGTGSNEGLGNLRSAVGMTASPALTPALTGLATAGSYTTPALTSTMTRYSSAPIQVPLTATEIVFELDWTPGTETAGTTNGIVVQGCQLEEAEPTQTVAGRFERVVPAVQLARAQRFFWQIADPAATVEIPSACFVTAANTTVKCGVWLPVQMQTAPTTTVSTATSFGIVVTAGTAGTCTTLAATASSNTVNSIGVTCTTGGTIALGSATPLIGAATSGTLNASADF